MHLKCTAAYTNLKNIFKIIHYIYYAWRIRRDVVFPFFCFFTLSKHIMNMYYFKSRK